jgi:exosortase/archaeosortase family protein
MLLLLICLVLWGYTMHPAPVFVWVACAGALYLRDRVASLGLLILALPWEVLISEKSVLRWRQVHAWFAHRLLPTEWSRLSADGLVLHTEHLDLVVTGSCASVTALLATCAAALMSTTVFLQLQKHRLLVLCLAPFFALLANGTRIALTVLGMHVGISEIVDWEMMHDHMGK